MHNVNVSWENPLNLKKELNLGNVFLIVRKVGRCIALVGLERQGRKDWPTLSETQAGVNIFLNFVVGTAVESSLSDQLEVFFGCGGV